MNQPTRAYSTILRGTFSANTFIAINMSSSHINFITLCGIYLLTTVITIQVLYLVGPVCPCLTVKSSKLSPLERSLTVDFPTSKSITEMFPGKGWKTDDTDHPSYIVSHQSSQKSMKKQNILGIIEIPLKEKGSYTFLRYERPGQVFWESMKKRSLVRDDTIYIYTHILGYPYFWKHPYINILSSCYVILSFIWPGHRLERDDWVLRPPPLWGGWSRFPHFPHLVNEHIVTILKQAFQVPNEQELKL